MRQYKWGIINRFYFHLFAQGLKMLRCQSVLHCFLDRKADAFARNYNIPVAYGSYEELADDPHVEVYIGTPTLFIVIIHCFACRKKKAVLCEKPFAMNTDQVEKMIIMPKNNCFLMSFVE